MLRKLTTLEFIVLSYLKELNQTAPRFMTQELDLISASMGVRRIFPGGGNYLSQNALTH